MESQKVFERVILPKNPIFFPHFGRWIPRGFFATKYVPRSTHAHTAQCQTVMAIGEKPNASFAEKIIPKACATSEMTRTRQYLLN